VAEEALKSGRLVYEIMLEKATSAKPSWTIFSPLRT
jgi:hypothetical protein